MNIAKRNHRNVFFDEFFKDWAGGSQMAHRVVPPVNIVETATAFNVALVAPGFKKEDFNIEVDKDVLTISSQVKTEQAEQAEGKFTRREFVQATFKRAFTLPETVKADEINAAYVDGILTIVLPKKEAVQPEAKRLIEIS